MDRRMPAHRPSFRYKIHEQRRRYSIWKAAGYQAEGYRITGKLEALEFFDDLGLQRPLTLHRIDGLDSLTPDHLVGPCIVKPVSAHSSRGVTPLIPEGGRYRDVRDDTMVTWQKLIHNLHESQQEHGYPDQWLIEELLQAPDGRLPDDFKFYAFRGTVGYVLQRRLSPLCYKWWTADWQEARVGKHEKLLDSSLQLPSDPAKMMEKVEGLSATIPLPFMRVDVYDTDRGVVFGELTPHPGGFWNFNAEADEFLGDLYERAEAEWLTSILAASRTV